MTDTDNTPKRVRIIQDEDGYPPEDDGIKLALLHDRYNLPNDENLDKGEIEALLDNDDYIALWVYGYDHGYFDISTQIEPYWFHYAWDGGRLGVAYVKYSYAVKGWGQTDKDNIREQIRAYVAEWAAYLLRDAYGLVLEFFDEDDGRWYVEDSVWGFYGLESALEGAKTYYPGVEIVED